MDKKKNRIRLDRENRKINATKRWTNVILPNWEEMKNKESTIELWWNGIPPNIRPRIWSIILIDHTYQITPEVFEALKQQAENAKNNSEIVDDSKGNKESTVNLIHLDLGRTFPALSFFKEGGPFHPHLRNVLEAFVCHRPDIGYVQGMSYLAAMLLLYMEEFPAFQCICSIINKSTMLESFYAMNMKMMNKYYVVIEEAIEEYLPRLHAHFQNLGIIPGLFFLDWCLTVFSKSIPLDISSRIWDIFLIEGDSFIIRASIGILSVFEEHLINEIEFVHCLQVLQNINEDSIIEEDLFEAIKRISFTENKLAQYF
eukprot:TRINITY_DN4110_c0_g1_i2.p1 TRINITY_DN4110_c0_g1~~TRINITY_DN4110_c0_g1_i2.p1  ORF type:complete len:314 (-),score=57.91 TRINITY_DN4110_c0_g1_i2:41-982(-)